MLVSITTDTDVLHAVHRDYDWYIDGDHINNIVADATNKIIDTKNIVCINKKYKNQLSERDMTKELIFDYNLDINNSSYYSIIDYCHANNRIVSAYDWVEYTDLRDVLVSYVGSYSHLYDVYDQKVYDKLNSLIKKYTVLIKTDWGCLLPANDYTKDKKIIDEMVYWLLAR